MEIKCDNTECGKLFECQITDDRYPGCKDKEEIICPYCGKVVGYEMTSGISEHIR